MRLRVKHLLPLLLLAGLAYGLFSPGRGPGFVEVDVPAGATATSVAAQLTEKGLLPVPHTLLAWVKARRAGSKIKPGRYQFASGRSAFWIADDLIKGRTHKVKVTIPEGFASWQIAERLDALKICDGALFKQAVDKEGLEGYLFPATYELDLSLDPVAVAHFLQDQFEERWTPELEGRAKEIGFSKERAVTLASIIEREARVAEERPLVSAVYHNRMKIKMPLQADPTVQYAQGTWKPRLTYNDYRNTKSPYNTYLHPGLPPGPICSPGVESIKAALWPAKSDALYFVAAEDGRHTFSATYREHTNKVNRRNRMRRKNR